MAPEITVRSPFRLLLFCLFCLVISQSVSAADETVASGIAGNITVVTLPPESIEALLYLQLGTATDLNLTLTERDPQVLIAGYTEAKEALSKGEETLSDAITAGNLTQEQTALMNALFTYFQTRFDQKIFMQQGMLSYDEAIGFLKTGEYAKAAETLGTAAGYMGQSQEKVTSLLAQHPQINSTVTALITGDHDSYRYLEEILVPMISDREEYYKAMQHISEVLAAGGVEDPAMKEKFKDAAEALVSLQDSAFVGNEARFWVESMGIGREGM